MLPHCGDFLDLPSSVSMGQQSSKQRTSTSSTTVSEVRASSCRRGRSTDACATIAGLKGWAMGHDEGAEQDKVAFEEYEIRIQDGETYVDSLRWTRFLSNLVARRRPFSTRLLNLRRRAQKSTRTQDTNLNEVSVPSPARLDEQSVRSDGSSPPFLVPCTESADGLQHAQRSTEHQSSNRNPTRTADRSNQSTPIEHTHSESASSRTANGTDSNSSNPPEERLQTNIDVLASLLSMATAATASSLLNNHADVLATLSSDSSSGSQLSPQRARVAWSILEHLFHLRSNRRTTSSNNVELLQDLSLALLTSRFMNVPPLGPLRERAELQPGSFERFLVDVHARVRASLQEDHERSASGKLNRVS